MDAAKFLLLAAPKRQTVTVLGESLTVRELTVGERAQVIACAQKEPTRLPALLLRLCAVNEDGSPMFDESHTEALSASAPSVLEEVAKAIMQLSGMGGDADEKKA